MTPATYEEEVRKLALYPHAGEGTLASHLYPVLGLNGEAGEVMGKLALHGSPITDLLYSEAEGGQASAREEVVKELGDVLWYIVALSLELSVPFTPQAPGEVTFLYSSSQGEDILRAALHLSGACGFLAEKMKKALRDDATALREPLRAERRDLLVRGLQEVWQSFDNLLSELSLTWEEVAEANVAKLTSRRARGQLHGDGDNR